jgi:hypothetical protein
MTGKRVPEEIPRRSDGSGGDPSPFGRHPWERHQVRISLTDRWVHLHFSADISGLLRSCPRVAAVSDFAPSLLSLRSQVGGIAAAVPNPQDPDDLRIDSIDDAMVPADRMVIAVHRQEVSGDRADRRVSLDPPHGLKDLRREPPRRSRTVSGEVGVRSL